MTLLQSFMTGIMEDYSDLMLIGGCVVSTSLAVALHLVGQKFTASHEKLSSTKYEEFVETRQSLGALLSRNRNKRAKSNSKAAKTRPNSDKLYSAKIEHTKKPPVSPCSINDDEPDISDLQSLASLRRKERNRIEKSTSKSSSTYPSQKCSTSQSKKRGHKTHHNKSSPKPHEPQSNISPTSSSADTINTSPEAKPPSVAQQRQSLPSSLERASVGVEPKLDSLVPINEKHTTEFSAAICTQIPLSDNPTTSLQDTESVSSQDGGDSLTLGSPSLQTAFDLITHSGFSYYELHAIVGVATAQQDADALRKRVQTTPRDVRNAAATGYQAQLQTLKLEQQTQLDRLQKNLKSLQGELSLSETQKSRLQSQLSQLSNQSETLRRENKHLQDAACRNDSYMKDLKSQACTDCNVIHTLKYELNIGQGQIFELEAKIELQATEILQLKQENSTLSQALSESKMGPILTDVVDTKENGDTVNTNGTAVQEDLVSTVAALGREVEQLKNKNNELRRKNWSLTDSLNEAEKGLVTLAELQDEIEKKSSQIHDLKATNHSLKGKNAELCHRLDEHVSAASHLDDLRRERNSLRRDIDDRDDQISRLEAALVHERELHVATEQECRNLIETQLPRSLSHIEAKHHALLDDLQQKLDDSDARILQLQQEISESNRDRLYYDDQSNELEEKLSQSEKRYLMLVGELEHIKKAFETSSDQNDEDRSTELVHLVSQLVSNSRRPSVI